MKQINTTLCRWTIQLTLRGPPIDRLSDTVTCEDFSCVAVYRKVCLSRRLWSNGFNGVLNDRFCDVFTLFYYSFSSFMSFARDRPTSERRASWCCMRCQAVAEVLSAFCRSLRLNFSLLHRDLSVPFTHIEWTDCHVRQHGNHVCCGGWLQGLGTGMEGTSAVH